MLENNGRTTPRFFNENRNKKKNITNLPLLKDNQTSLVNQEKPAFITYKPKTKKYFTSFNMINHKKENLQYISDTIGNYKFMENYKNKYLIDTAFNIDNNKLLSPENNLYDNSNNSKISNNFEKFFETLSDFKSNKTSALLTTTPLNKNNSLTQNNFMPKPYKIFKLNKSYKKNNLYPIETKSNFYSTGNNFNNTNYTNFNSTNFNSQSYKTQYNNSLYDLKFDNNLNYLNLTTTENSDIINCEPIETETKFFKRYFSYLDYITKKRKTSPSKIKNNIEIKFTEKKNNVYHLDSYDLGVEHFREAINKSAKILVESLKEKNKNNIDLEKTKKIIFKEIGENKIFEILIDKIFRKVTYVNDKNIEIFEDYVVNLINYELSELTINTKIPKENAGKNKNTKKKINSHFPDKIGINTISAATSPIQLNENLSVKKNSRNKLDSKNKLNHVLYPIGELENEVENKKKKFSSMGNQTEKKKKNERKNKI